MVLKRSCYSTLAEAGGEDKALPPGRGEANCEQKQRGEENTGRGGFRKEEVPAAGEGRRRMEAGKRRGWKEGKGEKEWDRNKEIGRKRWREQVRVGKKE